MKIAVHILAYNVSGFIASVLANVEPYVDRIYIAHSERPFGYTPDSRLNHRNPTSVSYLRSLSLSSKVLILEGDWLAEDMMRNSCLAKAREEGMDWLITQDADEFYTEAGWASILRALRMSVGCDQLVTTWYNFWKSSDYVLVHKNGSIKDTNAGFALRCGSNAVFVNRRITNAVSSRIIDVPCYHYGYVMTDAQMREKLSTWSHSHEVNRERWYADKWLGWSENSKNLHPVAPWIWRRAIRFPLEQPVFAHEFSLPISMSPFRSRFRRIGEKFHDAHVDFRQTLVSIRDLVR
jgi:hypothetical protein